MLARIWSAAVFGIHGYRVAVEADVGEGFPRFLVVGLPDAAVRESKERVISAIRNSGIKVPFERVVVNLAPADIRKEGASFDLPMAVAVLAAAGNLSAEIAESHAFLGELSLDGRLRPVRGVLPMALALREAGHRSLVLPHANCAEAAIVDGIRLYAAHHLSEIVSGEALQRSVRPSPVDPTPNDHMPDFADVRGQATARRACEIAAAGGHHLAMAGPPGVGKTMIARRLPGILPPLDTGEALESARIHSVAGLLDRDNPLITSRPFRAPHHTTTVAGLLGGSWPPRPGEVSLAHHGVLFLDEVPEMRRDALEALREPLEDGRVRLVRGSYRVVFPARFRLIIAMNPCACGYLGHPTKACRCSWRAARSYRSKISGPLIDRIDLFVELSVVRYRDLTAAPAESSAAIRARVLAAREHARRRAGGKSVVNADLDAATLRRTCEISGPASRMLELAVERLGFSARAHDRVLRLAKTIADLSGRDRIEEADVTEAMQYRWQDPERG